MAKTKALVGKFAIETAQSVERRIVSIHVNPHFLFSFLILAGKPLTFEQGTQSEGILQLDKLRPHRALRQIFTLETAKSGVIYLFEIKRENANSSLS
jgi:hypothetical protein